MSYKFNAKLQQESRETIGEITISDSNMVGLTTYHPEHHEWEFLITEKECDQIFRHFSDNPSLSSDKSEFVLNIDKAPCITGRVNGRHIALISSAESPIPNATHNLLMELVARTKQNGLRFK